MFGADFDNVVEVLKRDVSSNGRLSGLSRHRGKTVYVVVLKQDIGADPPAQQHLCLDCDSGSEHITPINEKEEIK